MIEFISVSPERTSVDPDTSSVSARDTLSQGGTGPGAGDDGKPLVIAAVLKALGFTSDGWRAGSFRYGRNRVATFTGGGTALVSESVAFDETGRITEHHIGLF